MKIKLEKFKCFEKSNMEFKSINLLSGKNSIGKSSILDAIEIFHNIRDAEINLFSKGKSDTDFLIWDGFDSEELFFKISIDGIKKTHKRDKRNPNRLILEPKSITKRVIRIKANRLISEEQVTGLPNRVSMESNNNIYHILKCNKTLLDEINNSLNVIFGNMNFKLEINKFGEDKVFYECKYGSKSIDNSGFGIKFILPILINCFISNEKIILIENPEIHLHPEAQSKLMEILIDVNIRNGNTLFIETHSDHIINAFRKAIYFNDSNQVGIYYLKDFLLKEIKIKNGRYSEFTDGFLDQGKKDFEEILNDEL